MAILLTDIDKKIDELFNNDYERQTAKQLILSLWQTSLNVGPDQLARSILIISDGELSKIQEIFSSNFYEDPRDVIMEAETKAGNPKHYFTKPLSDVDVKNLLKIKKNQTKK